MIASPEISRFAGRIGQGVGEAHLRDLWGGATSASRLLGLLEIGAIPRPLRHELIEFGLREGYFRESVISKYLATRFGVDFVSALQGLTDDELNRDVAGGAVEAIFTHANNLAQQELGEFALVRGRSDLFRQTILDALPDSIANSQAFSRQLIRYFHPTVGGVTGSNRAPSTSPGDHAAPP